MVDEKIIKIKECTICQRKVCEKSKNKSLEFCEYGVAYFNDNGKIFRSRERVSKNDIAANLRHELNRVLQFIINQAEDIDPNVSVRTVDLKSAASKIVGATVILDQFIEMMCGVHHFHHVHTPNYIGDNIRLKHIIRKQIDTYSLISNTRRAKELHVSINIPDDIKIKIQSAKIEYLVAIFCDNLWKYSIPDYPVEIGLKKGGGTVNLSFSNKGISIPTGVDIFEAGAQLDKKSEGFGYGLAWAQILLYQYNHELGLTDSDNELKIKHDSIDSGNNESIHTFTIENLIVG